MENIMMDSNIPVIIDFGISNLSFCDKNEKFYGDDTLPNKYYPEYLFRGMKNKFCINYDLWSFFLICFSILSGEEFISMINYSKENHIKTIFAFFDDIMLLPEKTIGEGVSEHKYYIEMYNEINKNNEILEYKEIMQNLKKDVY